jgi:endonuclease/exonuclease/phosphatase (EEP) superfamily protein YafD
MIWFHTVARDRRVRPGALDDESRSRRGIIGATRSADGKSREMPHNVRWERASAAAVCAAGFVTSATLLPLIRKGYWWLRIWDFPRLQIASVGAISAAALAYSLLNKTGKRREALALAAAGASVAVQLGQVIRYTPLFPKQSLRADPSQRSGNVRLLISNILMTNRQAERFLAVVRDCDPDIVCVLEPDAWWERQLASLEADYPHVLKCPLENTYGMLLYSRLPLSHSRIVARVEPDVPSMDAWVTLPSGDRFRFYCVHPRPPVPFQDSFERDAELVLVGKEVHEHNEPAIVAGDLNDVAWSYTTRLFQRISGMLDPRVGRGLYNSFHTKHPLLRFPLDHVFHTPEFSLVELRRLGHCGSDHFPILAEFCYRPQDAHKQETEEPTPEDEQEAEEILEDGLEG